MNASFGESVAHVQELLLLVPDRVLEFPDPFHGSDVLHYHWPFLFPQLPHIILNHRFRGAASKVYPPCDRLKLIDLLHVLLDAGHRGAKRV